MVGSPSSIVLPSCEKQSKSHRRSVPIAARSRQQEAVSIAEKQWWSEKQSRPRESEARNSHGSRGDPRGDEVAQSRQWEGSLVAVSFILGLLLGTKDVVQPYLIQPTYENSILGTLYPDQSEPLRSNLIEPSPPSQVPLFDFLLVH